MTALAELCAWAAAPFLALSAWASLVAARSGRRELGGLGARATDAACVFALVALVGLGVALVRVDLRYSYVASHAGFQQGWPWRLAGLWSGPGGAALLLSLLLAVAAAMGGRGDAATRGTTARRGCLAVLALFALLVVARTAPFARAATPELAGTGLPLPMANVSWQVEMLSAILACASSAFVFAGQLGGQLVESPGRERGERRGVMLTAGLLIAAALAAAWRAYASGGRLLDAVGMSLVIVHVPAGLLALAHLHAPPGLAVPAWAIRWRRILGVALFPSTLGAAAAVLAARGAEPPTVPWVGALAVGILSGAMAGVGSGRRVASGTERIPGFGPYAGLGGLVVFTGAGVAAGWGLVRAEAMGMVAWLLLLVTLTGVTAWSAQRRAGGWRRVWPVAVGLATVGAVAVLAVTGMTPLALVAGLTLGLCVGLVAELVRLSRVGVRTQGGGAAVFRTRTERRWASAVGHLGIAILVLGFAAQPLTRSEARQLQPGETLSVVGGIAAGVGVTYLGLSRYQVGHLDREVASFRLDRGGRSRLVTAARTFDWSTRTEVELPALVTGPARDVIVSVEGGRGADDGLVCRLAVRPLGSLVWLGGALLIVSLLARTRPAP